jgi:hypothetical protein
VAMNLSVGAKGRRVGICGGTVLIGGEVIANTVALRRDQIEIIRVTGQELRLQPGTMILNVEEKLALDLVQGSKENVEEDHPVKRAERVTRK